MPTRSPLLLAMSAALLCSGCQLSPFRQLWATPPTALPGDDGEVTRANEDAGDAEDADGVFVGLALSGGGSRAAVFAGEVIDQFHRSGAMSRVDYISSVSGGSLAGAYYCLSRDPGEAGHHDLVWDDDAVREHLSANFWLPFILRGLSPANAFLYWFTGYNRSCLMADVFDAVLLHGKTLGDLNPKRPRLLINATRLENGQRFTFTDQTLAKLAIRPAPLRAADCVQASSAVPGFFQVRAFPKYEKAGGDWHTVAFAHLMDGGVYDNLGVDALLDVYRRQRALGRFKKGAVIILCDSSVPTLQRDKDPQTADEQRFADLRRGLDYVLELRSLVEAGDIIFELNRRKTIEMVRGLEKTENIRLIHLWYGRGVISEVLNGNGARRATTGINLEDPLRAITDVSQLLTVIAPTALSISPERVQSTREAARSELNLHRDKLREAGLPIPE